VSGDHRVVLADCLGPEGLAALGDKSVDHVITDPPYEAEAHTLQRRIKRDAGTSGYGGTDQRVAAVESLGFAPITEETRAAVAREVVRVCRGWAIVFCQAEAIFAWRRDLQAAGAKWRRPMVWVKPDGQPCLTGDRPGMGYESMAAAWCGDGRSEWNGGGRLGVYTFVKSTSNGNEHPTQKPLPLMEALVRDFTQPGDLIADPFAGSGSLLVAAKRLGRRAVGWEREAAYHAIATKRIDGTREQLRFFEGDGRAAGEGAGR
jgi:site-specific DNA-methyltransferase (adenine-specific)